MAAYKPVTHVIFDLDGTLLDTDRIDVKIQQSIAERYGKVITWKLRAKCMGRNAHDSAATIVRELQLPITAEEYQSIVINDFSSYGEEELPNSKTKPGVERLVRHLHARGIPMAIASSSKRVTYDMKVRYHQELFSMFHHVVLAPEEDEVKRGKPFPDVFLICSSRFEDSPPTEKVLVIEDAASGVQAALAAGMQVVMVPDPRIDVSFTENATLVLKSLEQFQPELFDTDRIHEKIHQSIAERYGKIITWKLRAKCMGRNAYDSASTIVREVQLPITAEEYRSIIINDFSSFCEEELPNSKTKPGVERLVRHLHAKGIPMAIASSSKRVTYDMKVRYHQELFSMFRHAVFAPDEDEVKRGKPFPDVFLVCSSRFEDSPPTEKVLVIEDAASGVQAALAAGMQVVMVPDPRIDVSFTENATLVLKSLEQFQPELFGLPPFDSES